MMSIYKIKSNETKRKELRIWAGQKNQMTIK